MHLLFIASKSYYESDTFNEKKLDQKVSEALLYKLLKNIAIECECNRWICVY